MPLGFFRSSPVVNRRAPVPLVAQCGRCKLYEGCLSPKMPASGKGRRKVLIIGEAPGENEDKEGVQFIGKAGQRLIRSLRTLGVELRRDCWIDNSLRCRPPKNATPTDAQISFCRPNVLKAIKDLQPDVTIPLGWTAVKSLIGYLWRGDLGTNLTRWVGWRIPCQRLNSWICPTFHPSYLERIQDPVADMYFERHLEAAFALEGKPWKEVPNYRSQVKVIMDSNDAGTWIYGFRNSREPAAFDYETNMLKPDSDKAEIICCSLSNGRKTIAFPWVGRVIEEMRMFLVDPNVPKIGANGKFEERWTRKILKCSIKNWLWDDVLGAHWLDNRPSICGVGFQAIVNLGVDTYWHHLEPYMRSRGGNDVNRLREAELSDVLFYCGMDSLVEWHIAMKQMEQGEWKTA